MPKVLPTLLDIVGILFFAIICLALSVFIYFLFHFRTQVNQSHLLLKAVSDTSIYTVSFTLCCCDNYFPVKGQEKKANYEVLFENSFSLIRSDSSYWTRQSISTNSRGYRE